MKATKFLLIIFLAIGLLWAKSSYGKVTGGTFVSTLSTTLTKTADKNPYPWFKQFLISTAVPNSQTFGSLTMWGELLSAVAIVLGAILLLSSKQAKLANLILLLGLAGGAFLNIIFWLGFGYTSPSTDSLNLLMAVVEIIGIFYILSERSA